MTSHFALSTLHFHAPFQIFAEFKIPLLWRGVSRTDLHPKGKIHITADGVVCKYINP
jgi:hypothetical protein